MSFTPFSTHREVSPIGKVVQPDESESNEAREVEVIAVNSLTSTYQCIARGCNSKVKKYQNERRGQCTKCGSLQKLSKCSPNLTAQLIIKGPAFKKPYTLMGTSYRSLLGNLRKISSMKIC